MRQLTRGGQGWRASCGGKYLYALGTNEHRCDQHGTGADSRLGSSIMTREDAATHCPFSNTQPLFAPQSAAVLRCVHTLSQRASAELKAQCGAAAHAEGVLCTTQLFTPGNNESMSAARCASVTPLMLLASMAAAPVGGRKHAHSSVAQRLPPFGSSGSPCSAVSTAQYCCNTHAQRASPTLNCAHDEGRPAHASTAWLWAHGSVTACGTPESSTRRHAPFSNV